MVPQLPQWVGAVCVLTQPSSPQLVKPGSQAAPQLPVAQVRAPLSTAGHSAAQPPQLSGSLAVSMQVTSQSACPALHTRSHAPRSHAAEPFTGALHSALQEPQFSGSLAASTSQPFTTLRVAVQAAELAGVGAFGRDAGRARTRLVATAAMGRARLRIGAGAVAAVLLRGARGAGSGIASTARTQTPFGNPERVLSQTYPSAHLPSSHSPPREVLREVVRRAAGLSRHGQTQGAD